MSDTFVNQLYNKLCSYQVPWTILNDSIKQILKENSLEILSKPLPKELIERSICPVKPRTYTLSYKSLDFPGKLVNISFAKENMLIAFLTGLGANSKIHDVEICFTD